MGIHVKAKCHNCGEINNVNIEPIDANTILEIPFVCSNCGALNTLFFDPNDPDPENQEWLCIPPDGFEWILPAGKIMPIIGEPIYVSAFGEHLSRKIYIERYKLDPEIAYQYMRRKRTENISNDIADKLIQSVVTQTPLDLTKVKQIEVLCKKCGNICRLNFCKG
jgi:hypothetical protein